MQIVLNVLHLFLAIGLVGLVLIQHGKGADAGAAFGSGASATVFGARGSGSFLSRSTAVLAVLFFLTSMALAYFASQVDEPRGLMEGVEIPKKTVPAPVEAQQDVPVVPQAAAPAADVLPVPVSEAMAPPSEETTPALAPDVPTPVDDDSR